MKKSPAYKIQRIALLFAMPLVLALLTPSVFAQESNTSEKIQLMSEALRARDSGDLLLARQKTEALIALAPSDPNVQSLLLSINESLEEEGITVPNTSEPEKNNQENLDSENKSNESLDKPSVSMKQKVMDLVRFNKLLPTKEVSPEFIEQSRIIENLFLVCRSQIASGDYGAALNTLNEIEARDPSNTEAKTLSLKLSKILGDIQSANLYKTREDMLNAVNDNWERPKVFQLENKIEATESEIPSLVRKLDSIILPRINFNGMELTRVVETLSELSVEYDKDGEGVNIVVLFNPTEMDPEINITLRNLSLNKILQYVTQQVNFTYDVGDDVVTIQPSDSIGGTASTITEFFPITRATVIRLTGFRDVSSSSSAISDPFADMGSSSSGPSQDEETEALQKFFQNAGVNFEGVTGSSLAFDGEQLIVTQTSRNIERLRTILRNYSEVKQVEIEAKFLEVAQNDLDELGFNWGIMRVKDNTTNRYNVINDPIAANQYTSYTDANGNLQQQQVLPYNPAVGSSSNGAPAATSPLLGQLGATIFQDNGLPATANTQFRGLGDIEPNSGASKKAIVGGSNIEIAPPEISGALDFAENVLPFLTDTFTDGDYSIDLQLNAIARKTGSDLMSAPKVTVLSGKRANIIVAQELRFPESYGDIQSTVSSGGDVLSGGSSAISITAGTPQDFQMRRVGVEMAVTPSVESDDTISLLLEPKVTEFEGFVEYGGPSIALTGNQTAVVPAGFYQPVFSTREISTEVTIYDGATVVMGGLTRDEVRSINDRVPLLGDLPVIGRLFRSEGETRQKRNLLIFVTANLVSPGGTLSNQSYDNIKSKTLYQAPAVTTPSGNRYRNVTIKD